MHFQGKITISWKEIKTMIADSIDNDGSFEFDVDELIAAEFVAVQNSKGDGFDVEINLDRKSDEEDEDEEAPKVRRHR